MTRRRYILLLALNIPMLARDRQWMSGTVASIEQVPARMMRNNASTNYSIHTDSATYVLEDAASTYYTGPPKQILAVGDVVQLSLDGSKHAIVKTDKMQKRLRLIGTSTGKQ